MCQYCLQALAAQPLVSGPAVTVVRVAPRCQSLATSPEPESPEEVTKRCRLISLRAKWSSRETARVCRQCVGYDAVTATLDEAFAPGKTPRPIELLVDC